jgi:hypothetical protein
MDVAFSSETFLSTGLHGVIIRKTTIWVTVSMQTSCIVITGSMVCFNEGCMKVHEKWLCYVAPCASGMMCYQAEKRETREYVTSRRSAHECRREGIRVSLTRWSFIHVIGSCSPWGYKPPLLMAWGSVLLIIWRPGLTSRRALCTHWGLAFAAASSHPAVRLEDITLLYLLSGLLTFPNCSHKF